MTLGHYIIGDDGQPKQVDLLEWAAWFENVQNRIVAQDQVTPDVRVSTVFLGLDHNWAPSGPPVLWETMIFGGPHDQFCDRYSSLEDAMSGHAAAVARVLNSKTRVIDLE